MIVLKDGLTLLNILSAATSSVALSYDLIIAIFALRVLAL
jgi:hypothetical protein